MAKVKLIVKRELPSLFCHVGRHWVDSQEKVNVFTSVDGVKQRPQLWTCSAHRLDPTATVISIHQSTTAAEIAKDERAGPVKKIVKVIEPRGASVRAVLECGHEHTVLKTAKTHRCRKCRFDPLS
jgi:hypothetical protein